MDSKTFQALKASIEKWERNARVERREDVLIDADDCPLCQLFFSVGCVGCPVAEAVYDTHCNNTPFQAAVKVWFTWDYGTATAADFRAAAQAEVEFLKSLLPEGDG